MTLKLFLLASLFAVACSGEQTKEQDAARVVPGNASDGYFINKDNYRQFCNSNEDLLKGKPRGIVIEFPGLGGGSCLGGRQDPMGSYTNSWSKFPETAAAAGLVHVYLMPGPWSWMNPGAVREADLVIDALRAKFGLAEGTPLVAVGGSMGGLGALVFTSKSRHRVTACAAACPCYDALAHYHCKASFARTYVAAVAPLTEKPLVEGLKEISPVHLLAKMPDIPYFIVCDCNDEIFPEAGMDDYVAKLRARASNVTYEKLPGKKHGEFTPECRARLHDFVCGTPAQVAAASAEGIVTVRPASTDEVLDNPGMGLYAYQYSNRLWAYGSRLKPGDTMDWFPGVNIVYFRVPWCELEPAEGDYRWDIIDSVAQNWIARGKQIAIRVTCCENRYKYPTPKWVFDAGAKATEYSMYENFYNYWKIRSDTWSKEKLYEPDYTDPVFLQKLENFLKAFARRYDGNPSVAFCDIGTFGMWGEGHTDYTSRMSPEKTFETVKVHMALWRKCLPNTYLVISDDVSGWASLEEDPPAMKYARELGVGFRDDSIMVEAPSDTRKHANGRALASWYHDNWARLFSKTSPVVVEHEHYDLSRARKNCWNDDWLVKSVEAYEASYLSVHGWPDEIYEKSGAAFKRAALRLGYRFELRQAVYPATVCLGEPFEIRSEWVNVGVARCYAGANVAWSLVDENGAVVWTSVDARTDFKDAQPKLADGECPFTVTNRVRFGCTSELPDRNDGVITHYRKLNQFPFGKKVPTMACGTYALTVSLGRPDGTPAIALPLRGGDTHHRYPIGTITVKE